MTTVHPTTNAYIQHDSAPCQGTQIANQSFQKHENKFSLLHWSARPQILSSNPTTSFAVNWKGFDGFDVHGKPAAPTK